MKLTKILSLAAIVGLCMIAGAQQTVTAGPYMATLETDPKSIEQGKPTMLDVLIMDSKSMLPSMALRVSASLSMPSMSGMTLKQPRVTAASKPGHYSVEVDLPHSGQYVLAFAIKDAQGKTSTLEFKLAPGEGGDMSHMHGMEGMEMKGAFTAIATQEGSGTTWQPASSPMFMKMLPPSGRFELGLMGTIQAGYVNAGGKRGDKGFFTDSMIMLMARRDLGGGTLGLDFMTSLDPIINGEFGVPDLFQTGETAHGVPLVDRQHPHNLFSEIAVSYSHPIGRYWSAFVYGGPVAEPALGNVMFMHRPSGMEIPEAPITHHWFDSTHISFGVATLGFEYLDKWKLEGSVFNGHEPGENRYTIGPVGLNSASGRVSYNPTRDWSFSASYGFLNAPEALSPGVDEHWLTFSAAYSHNFSNGDNLSATGYLGQKVVENSPRNTTAWLAEATLYHRKEAFFTRYERVDKDELYNAPPGDYLINKLLLGDVHNFYSRDGLEYGIGAYAGLYSFPSSLDPYYGKNPVTFGVFLRLRPSKM